jgi:hypothetical protein
MVAVIRSIRSTAVAAEAAACSSLSVTAAPRSAQGPTEQAAIPSAAEQAGGTAMQDAHGEEPETEVRNPVVRELLTSTFKDALELVPATLTLGFGFQVRNVRVPTGTRLRGDPVRRRSLVGGGVSPRPSRDLWAALLGLRDLQFDA